MSNFKGALDTCSLNVKESGVEIIDLTLDGEEGSNKQPQVFIDLTREEHPQNIFPVQILSLTSLAPSVWRKVTKNVCKLCKAVTDYITVEKGTKGFGITIVEKSAKRNEIEVLVNPYGLDGNHDEYTVSNRITLLFMDVISSSAVMARICAEFHDLMPIIRVVCDYNIVNRCTVGHIAFVGNLHFNFTSCEMTNRNVPVMWRRCFNNGC